MKVFLAFSFRLEDKTLVSHLERLLASHQVEVGTGEKLGGEQLTPEVQQRIDKCDALVALLSRREQKENDRYETHQWVKDELGYARAKQKRAIALVEDGVDLKGMYTSHECIHFKREGESLLESLLILSETIGLWNKEVGRKVKVQILPPKIAKQLAHGDLGVRYRLWLQDKSCEWSETTPRAEDDGRTFIWVTNVQENHLIQIQVKLSNETWSSPATTQWMLVTLSQGDKK